MSLVLRNQRPTEIIQFTPDDFELDNPQNLAVTDGQVASSTMRFINTLEDWSSSCLLKYEYPSSFNNAIIDGFRYRYINSSIVNGLGRRGAFELSLIYGSSYQITGSFERMVAGSAYWPDSSVTKTLESDQLYKGANFLHGGPDDITLFSGGTSQFSGVNGNYAGDFSQFYYDTPGDYGSGNKFHAGTFANTFSDFAGVAFRFVSEPSLMTNYTILTDAVELDIYYTPAQRGRKSLTLSASTVTESSAATVGIAIPAGVETQWNSVSNALSVNTTIATCGVGDCSAMLTPPTGSSSGDTLGYTKFLKYSFPSDQLSSIKQKNNKEIRILWRGRVECLDSISFPSELIYGGYVSVDEVVLKNANSGEILLKLSDNDEYDCRGFKIGSFGWSPTPANATTFRKGERDRAIALDLRSLSSSQIKAMDSDGFDIYVRWKLNNTINKYDFGSVPPGDETLTYCALAVNGAIFTWGYDDMEEGQSINRKKWWHATLSIKDRDNNTLLTQLTTIDPSNPAVNADPTIYAYADHAINCMDDVAIPVPAFLDATAPGEFLFKPTVSALSDCIVDINTYQDAINLNNRRTFIFERHAAFDATDTDCTATEPSAIDPFAYETIINNQNSNVFRYPVIPSYNQIGCCQVELSSVGTELPSSTAEGRRTRLWYILHNDTTDVYSLVSYDFALLSTALVNRGNIDMSQAPAGTKLYDITWISVDNTLIVLASDGVRQLFPGNSTTDAVLGDIIDIQDINQDGVVFPLDETSSIKPCMEYNHYSNNLFLFTGKTAGSTTSPVIYKLSYLNANFSIQQYAWLYTYPTLGELAFSSQDHAYVIIDSDLWNLDLSQGRFGTATPVYQDPPNSPTTPAPHLLGNMQTVNFAENPDDTITTHVLYSSNVIGQQFRVDTITEGTTLISGAIVGGSVVGSTTTLAGEDVRVLPFPFFPGQAPWLFMVDISASMAGSKITRIKNSLISFVRTYVRQGDKITVLWFRDSNDRIIKDLITYTDVNEVVNYINSNFVTSSTTSNFCGAFANIAQDFNDLKNLVILSDGTFDDCGTDSAEWQANLVSSITSIQMQNPQIVFRVVGVSATDEEKLSYIATASGGIYTRWNE